MSGAVSWEVLLWVIGVMVAAGGTVAGFLIWVWKLIGRFDKALADRDAAAGLEKERAKLVEDGLRRELNEYKVHAAETFATKEGVSAAVGRVESAVDRLTERIDRLLEAQATAPPSRSRSSS